MFKTGSTIPKIGEIRLGYVQEQEGMKGQTHKYVGIHPYLIVSNNTYNKFSGQSEAIPFTTKRKNRKNPVHVYYKKGEVDGLTKDSTLVIEGRDTLLNSQFSDPIGIFSDINWAKAAKAMIVQCPYVTLGVDGIDEFKRYCISTSDSMELPV